MTQLTKVLFIGVDSLEKDLILQWAEEGALPNFKSLMDRGAWGTAENARGLYVAGIWPTFYTGVSPANHAHYWYRQLVPGSYETALFPPSDVKGEPFWNQLSRKRKKIAVIDIPRSVPSKEINGIHIVDWDTHDPQPEGLCTSPPHLAKEVVEKFGAINVPNCNANRETASQFTEFRDTLIELVKKKKDLSSYYLNQGGWDLFLTVFTEGHCAGHQCWHLHDPRHPRYNRKMARAAGNPIKDVYIAIDSAVGELLEQVGSNTHTIVLSSNGMGPHFGGPFLLEKIIQQLEEPKAGNGRTEPKPSTPGRGNKFIADLMQDLQSGPWVLKKYPRTVKVIEWARDLLPAGVGIRKMLRSFKVARTSSNENQNPERLKQKFKRRYFQVPNADTVGGIRINLAGREPDGKIQPGAEFDELCHSLSRDLLSLTDVKTGEPFVKNVVLTRDIYQGKCMDDLPDILVEWNRDIPISTIYSPKTGEIHGEYLGVRSGDHEPDGLFFAAGPSIASGPVDRPVSMMDFAPTIASLLEIDLDGVEGASFLPRIGLK